MIKELGNLVEHFALAKIDVTIILNEEDALEIVKHINVPYSEFSIRQEGEYRIIGSLVGVDESLFVVEDVSTKDGILKYDETNTLIIPSYLPLELRRHFLRGSYERLIEIS